VIEAFRASSPKLLLQHDNDKDSSKPLFSFSDPARGDAARFERLDDVIMGGRSSSVLEAVMEEGVGPCAEYKGNLVVEVREWVMYACVCMYVCMCGCGAEPARSIDAMRDGRDCPPAWGQRPDSPPPSPPSNHTHPNHTRQAPLATD
jgi:hypothetical protein